MSHHTKKCLKSSATSDPTFQRRAFTFFLTFLDDHLTSSFYLPILALFQKPPRMEHLCIQCEETFRTSVELEVNRSYHNSKKQFFCSHCETSFANSGNLKTHIMIHTGVKGYDCLQCGKPFKTLQELRKHHRLHTGEKPFECSQYDSQRREEI